MFDDFFWFYVISLSVVVKNINVGTMLMFQLLIISDGVLCFLLFFCVIFLVCIYTYKAV